MDIETFYNLLAKVEVHLTKQKKRKDTISAIERLLITLSYLASGNDPLSIGMDYLVGESTVRGIIKETCLVIYKVLSPIYLKPKKKAAWRNIAKGFDSDWNLSNCIGAVDGKHIAITVPPVNGPAFFNYKHFHSIVLLAACNHRYEFTIVEVGAPGGESDGGILSRSEFGKRLQEKKVDIPEELTKLPDLRFDNCNTDIETPFYFVGDSAFKMTVNFMRPYPGSHLEIEKTVFNYRLSRGRRCIENAFGILTARWRVLKTTIPFRPNTVDVIVLATVCLHNYLMSKTQKLVRQTYCPLNYTDSEDLNGDIINGLWRSEILQENSNTSDDTNMSIIEKINYSHAINGGAGIVEAYTMRDKLAKYFYSPQGKVPWQDEYLNRGRYRE